MNRCKSCGHLPFFTGCTCACHLSPRVKEADPELERLLAEEEEIERSIRMSKACNKIVGDITVEMSRHSSDNKASPHNEDPSMLQRETHVATNVIFRCTLPPNHPSTTKCRHVDKKHGFFVSSI